MRLLRFTTRRLMALVAVVAVALGCKQMWEVRTQRLKFALIHNALAMIFRVGYAHFRRDPERSAYHEALKFKYEQAARHPWLPVPPDMPEPK